MQSTSYYVPKQKHAGNPHLRAAPTCLVALGRYSDDGLKGLIKKKKNSKKYVYILAGNSVCIYKEISNCNRIIIPSDQTGCP